MTLSRKIIVFKQTLRTTKKFFKMKIRLINRLVDPLGRSPLPFGSALVPSARDGGETYVGITLIRGFLC